MKEIGYERNINFNVCKIQIESKETVHFRSSYTGAKLRKISKEAIATNTRTLINYMVGVGGCCLLKKKDASRRESKELRFPDKRCMGTWYRSLNCTHMFYMLFCM